jgi:tetratricopeptide (TPR) repeat protein
MSDSADNLPANDTDPSAPGEGATGPKGNTYEMSGDFRGAFLNINAKLSGVTQKIINQYTIHETPPVWSNVPPLPPHFIGRDELADSLINRLTSREDRTFSAVGLPGVGKTALASAIAHHQQILDHFKDGVLWAGLGQQPDVMSALGSWAAALSLDESELVNVDQRRQAVQQAIGQRHLLLVIDDAWELDTVQVLRCGGPNCVHLLTSRDSGLGRAFSGVGQVIVIPTLDDDPAFSLLQEIAPEVCQFDSQAVRELAQTVGGLPLALELLGSYLARPESSLFASARERALVALRDPAKRLQLAQARLGGLGQAVTLQETIALSLEGLQETVEGQRAVTAFYALGAFAPKPETFSLEAAKAVTGCDEVSLALLVAHSLVELQEDRLALHQALADKARMRLDDAAVGRHQAFYLALVNEDREDWRRIGAAYGQIKWAWAQLPSAHVLEFIEGLRVYQRHQGLWADYLEWAYHGLDSVRAAGNKKVEGALLNNIGIAYTSLSQAEKALEYYRRALSIREEIDDREGMAATDNNIGVVYDTLGQREKALEYYHRAAPILEELGDQEGLATTLNNIGLVYESLGQSDNALSHYNRALPISQEVGDRTGVAQTLNNIGLLYYNLGQMENALDHYNRALPILEELGDRVRLAALLNNLGLVYFSTVGQREKAFDFYDRALSIRKELGDRTGISQTLTNIGLVYHNLGQWAEAIAYYKRAVPLMEEVGNWSDLAFTLNKIGLAYYSLGQQEEALDYYHRALPIMEQLGDRFGESDTRDYLATIYRLQGRLDEAAAELRRVVDLDRLTQSPNLERNLAALTQLEAELVARQDRE